MGKNKNRVLQRGIPTGNPCISYTNKCALCGKRRPKQNRIVEHRYESYHCRCRDSEGNQLSSKSPDKVKCTKPAINDTTKCYLHGGASLRGEASPRYIHGKYSKVISTHLVEAYERSINDEKVTRLNEQLALCDVREQELVEQLSEGGIAAALKKVDSVTAEMNKLLVGDEVDGDALRKVFEKLRTEVGEIRSNEVTWDKIHENMERRRTLAETENRHRERLQGVVLPEQLLQFQMQVIRILKEVLTDSVVLNEVAGKLRAITGPAPVQVELESKVVDGEVVSDG